MPRLTPDVSRRLAVALACVLAVWIYASIERTVGSTLEWLKTPADVKYNLLVRGFQAGQLNLKADVPAGLESLPDPYDPAANERFRKYPYNLHDVSLYQGKLYLYYGVVPALILYWPWNAVTGHYLVNRHAALIFCAAGFLAAVWLLAAMRRTYFPETGPRVAAACALALGLASGIPVLLQRPDVCEVPIACGYALIMGTLCALWQAMHRPSARGRWLAAASLLFGLAVGARPSLLFCGVVLLVPAAEAFRREATPEARSRRFELLLAAAGPAALVGLGLAAYNVLRFDNPLEFGQSYQLASIKLGAAPVFSLRYFWFNVRLYFLTPVTLGPHFPFVYAIAGPPVPAGHNMPEDPYGILANVPVAWMALAAPLGWMAAGKGAGRPLLRRFLAAPAIVFGISALTLCLYWGSNERYQVEFLPELILLAVAGILGAERVLAGRPAWRRAARIAWGGMLAWSVAFNLFASFENTAFQRTKNGEVMYAMGRTDEAIFNFREALRIEPGALEARKELAALFAREGRYSEAVPEFEAAARLNPDDEKVQNDYGFVLTRVGRMADSLVPFGRAVALKPDYALAQYNFGYVLARLGRIAEARTHFEAALKADPGYKDARDALAKLAGAGP